jgi:3-oxoacyl-[acyl-carrier protein] reductase
MISDHDLDEYFFINETVILLRFPTRISLKIPFFCCHVFLKMFQGKDLHIRQPDTKIEHSMPLTPFGSLAGRRAVVTGASSGIGRAIALELARGGADVVIHCRSSVSAAEQVRDECRGLGTDAAVLSCDFSQTENLSQFVEEAWSQWGPVDIWVNNAGADLLTGPDAKLEYSAKLQRLFDVDIRATLLLGRGAGRRMREARGGVILNIGWDQAERGMEGESGELFAAAKSAIMGFTRSLALSLAPQVRVNCIAPGWIRTAWGAGASDAWQERVMRETPLARWGTPEDIAWLARFLASDQAAYLTGQIINANGGAER